MRISEDDSMKLKELVSMARMGWWETYFTEQVYYCSDFVADLLGLDDDKISFKDFQYFIHEDYRERVLAEFQSFKMMDIYEQVFPIYSKYGLTWVSTKVGKKSVTENGNIRVLGMFQCISRQRMNVQKKTVDRLNSLLYQLNGISRTLFEFLHSDDTTQVINKILGDVLYQFNGDCTYIVKYDKVNSLQSCMYEIISSNMVSYKALWNNKPLYTDEWWTQKILSGSSIIAHTPEKFPIEAAHIKRKMKEMNIKSLMAVPLNSKDGVWGYMGINIGKEYREWSNEDYQWFNSLANIISICMELHRSELETNLERQYFRSIYQNIPVGIEMYDKDGYLIDANEKDMEIFGVGNKSDIMGVNLFDNPIINDDWRVRLKEGESLDYSYKYDFNRLGEYYPTSKKGVMDITSKSIPLFDSSGKLINTLITNIDNTETNKAYSKIQEFQEFFTLVGDYAKVGYAHFNAITRNGYAISSWYRNVGEKEGTPLTEIIKVHSHLHPEDRQVMLDFFDKVLRKEAVHLRKDIRILREDGNYTWTRVNVLVRDFRPKEGVIDMVCINYDITELKETEFNLIKEKERAENLDHLKSAFLANMSHEIRTPLNAIVGFSHLLIDAEDKEERKQYISIVDENTELLLQLISDILDISKIESGIFEFVKTDIDVNQLCNEIICSLRMKTSKEVELCFTEHLPECHLWTDKNRLTQVISNFINNALKFTSSGSISLGYNKIDNNLKFYVRDTGIGISADKLKSIFERFIKLNSFVHGTGLGLSICKSIVEQMGGTIGVESKEGEGSCFWFSIPYTLPPMNS